MYKILIVCLLMISVEVNAIERKWFNQNDVPGRELSANFWTVFGVQWLVYYIDQEDTIREHGSFESWGSNIFKTTFDKDDYHYNIYKHTFVGQYYYLFYRSRGYSQRDSFLWSFVSSAAFEYTIETLTEPPSHQDVYQTPVYGSILGYYTESLSDYLHDSDYQFIRLFSYLFNPFRILPSTKDVYFSANMIGNQKVVGVHYAF